MDELTEIRKSIGLTQKAMAEALGITPSAVSRLEAGARDPTDNRTLFAYRYVATTLRKGRSKRS